ncbi:hypothetical protein [Hyphomicrobium sp. CS1GBMeth3]|uniref:hypothetical protein n=1 Tax=Hyphomicrobium sp. CS1GBMeth3 TaxID=1892845 RepID=UPI000930DF68|nr:hypothetical protein [Hyphomicrobium sp. CS1GBMeth3]
MISKLRAGPVKSDAPEPPAKPETIGEWIGVALVLAMFAITGLVGLLTLWSGARGFLAGDFSLPMALFLVAMGSIFTTIGFGFFYFRFVKKPLWDAEERRLAARYPGQPWMLRKDWAARRIVHSNAGVAALLWIWNIGWWGGIAFIGTVNRAKIEAALAESWGSWIVAAIFLGAGLLGLHFAFAATRTYWRFGRTTLLLDSLPAYFGDRFRGTVEARLTGRPANPLKAELVCERLEWIRQLSGGKKTSKLKVEELVRASAEIPPSRLLVSRRSVRIPVEIDLPERGLESSLDSQGNGIRWTLHVETTAPDANMFACAFEVPVYPRRT